MNKKIVTRIFPVIHADLNPEGILNQIFTAYGCGADGVFLIHHTLSAGKFSDLINSIDQLARFIYKNNLTKWPPDFDIGVNYLGASPKEAASFFKPLMSMLWSDHSLISLDKDIRSSVAEATIKKIKSTVKHGAEFFGGVAFKYQRQPDYEELHRLISIACSVDGYIVTTSGEATGSAPAVEKIKMFREIMPTHKRLAIASGASVSNVASLKQAGVTDFLVASSICTDDILDPQKLKEFINEARQH